MDIIPVPLEWEPPRWIVDPALTEEGMDRLVQSAYRGSFIEISNPSMVTRLGPGWTESLDRIAGMISDYDDVWGY